MPYEVFEDLYHKLAQPEVPFSTILRASDFSHTERRRWYGWSRLKEALKSWARTQITKIGVQNSNQLKAFLDPLVLRKNRFLWLGEVLLEFDYIRSMYEEAEAYYLEISQRESLSHREVNWEIVYGYIAQVECAELNTIVNTILALCGGTLNHGLYYMLVVRILFTQI